MEQEGELRIVCLSFPQVLLILGTVTFDFGCDSSDEGISDKFLFLIANMMTAGRWAPRIITTSRAVVRSSLRRRGAAAVPWTGRASRWTAMLSFSGRRPGSTATTLVSRLGGFGQNRSCVQSVPAKALKNIKVLTVHWFLSNGDGFAPPNTQS